MVQNKNDTNYQEKFMRKILFRSFFIIFALSGLIFTGTAQSRMKCWINNDEVKECGNRIPPEYAQKEHSELGKGGLIRKKNESAKSIEVLEKGRLLVKKETEQKEIIAKKKMQDEMLLATFSNVADIEKARDERISALESIIKLTKTRNKKIEIDLKRRIQSVNDVNKTGATYSEALTKSIASLKRQIDNNNKFMKERYTEQENIRNSHNIDIERFKKLKKNKWLSE